jgi:hypothetical protein
MATITAGNDSFFLVDGVPKQRGEYEILTDTSLGLLGIYHVGIKGQYLVNCELKPFSEYNSGTFGSLAALVTHLQGILFL